MEHPDHYARMAEAKLEEAEHDARSTTASGKTDAALAVAMAQVCATLAHAAAILQADQNEEWHRSQLRG